MPEPAGAAKAGAADLEARVRDLDAAQAWLIERMASVVSHEIRNPLAVIKNSLYYIKTKVEASPAPDAKIVKHVGFMEAEVQRADAILGDILAYARMPEADRKPVKVDVLAGEVLDRLKVPDGVRLERRLACGDQKALLDQGLVSRALAALVDNAIEASPPGGTVIVASEVKDGGSVRFEVADAGPGVGADAAGKLFLPFFTTKPRNIGLGLAMARKAAERHKGRVDQVRRKGPGAAFELVLPLGA